MASSNKRFNLKWDECQNNFTTSVKSFWTNENFTDVTLISDDEEMIRAHRLVLSSNSEFFKAVLMKSTQPNLVLYMSGISQENLNYLLSYIYDGEVQMDQDKIESFLVVAKKLKVCGLVDAEIANENDNIERWLKKFDKKCEKYEKIINNSIGDDESGINKIHTLKIEQVVNTAEDYNEMSEIVTHDVEEITEVEDVIEEELIEVDNSVEVPEFVDVNSREPGVHKNKQGFWQCNICEYYNKIKKFVDSHATKHQPQKNGFYCNKCQIPYANKTDLKRHFCRRHKHIQ